MKIKKIKILKVSNVIFKIIWDNRHAGGSFDYVKKEINIGTKDSSELMIFSILCHEIMELVTVEMYVRLVRDDCHSDYIFVFDHRQFTTIMNIFSGLIMQFIQNERL